MMSARGLPGLAVGSFSIVLLCACGVQNPSEAGSLPAFNSIDEAYDAVDEVLGCESNPPGEPIVPMDGSDQLTSEQMLCAENVQVDLYPNEDALQKSYEIWADSHQGEVHLVRGQNWLVVDLTDVATGEPSTWKIERLAEELHGEYTVAG